MSARNYKDFNKIFIGESDIASVVLRSWNSASILNFGQDDSYLAYFVDEEIEIPAHYSLVFESDYWLKIFDDSSLAREIRADKIRVYRAGEMGCLIYAPGGSVIR